MKKINFRIREKIIVACLGSALVAMLLLTFLFVRASGSLIAEQAKSENVHTFDNMQNEMGLFLQNIETSLVEIYKDTDFLRDLESADIETLRENYQKRAEELARNRFATTDGVLAIYIYDSDNEIISTYRRAMTPKHNYPKDIYDENLGEEYNVKKVLDYIESDDSKMLISSYYNPYREKQLMRFVVKIHAPAKIEKKIGYVVCDIDTKPILSIMNKYVLNEESYIWLQPEGDVPIVSIGDMSEVQQIFYEELEPAIISGDEAAAKSLTKDDTILFKSSQDKYNLDAYCLIPQELLYQNQKLLTHSLISIAAITVLILAILMTFLTGTITKPLEELTKVTEEIRRGNTALRIETDKYDAEIAKLGNEFNAMLDEIQDLVGRELQNKLLLNQAEYKALQSQINPHFLYNTLDTMASIASIQECTLVSDLCQSLSSIFRYSLDIKHPYSTLAKEINHLKNYIFVMNVRMKNEVKYYFNIEDGILQDSIPRISLQPLVENALNHGLKNKRGEKQIRIEAKSSEDKLEITVEDNGVGMDAETVNARLKENSTDLVEAGSSIGIYNINARLKMLYGKEYGISVESVIEEGTKVTILIPRKKIEEL